MKIKMITLAAGPEGVWPPGMELELDDKMAIRLIEGGYATPVVIRRETAVVEPPEVRDGHQVDTDDKPKRRASKRRRS